MTFWKYADEHPWLASLFVIIVAWATEDTVVQVAKTIAGHQ